MTRFQAHKILDNYKSSSLLQINQALIVTGDADLHQNTTSSYRTLCKPSDDERMVGAGEVECQATRGMSLWTVVRHWQAS